MKLSLTVVFFVNCFIFSDASSQSLPEDIDARKLFEMCEATEFEEGSPVPSIYLINAGFCMGMIAGVHAILATNCYLKDEGYNPMPLLTAGPVPSVEAALQGFKNFMQENPRDWNQPAPHVLAASIASTFPCEH